MEIIIFLFARKVQMLKNKNVLVTGGAGFIGSHLIDALIPEQPENIFVLDNFFLGKKRNLIEAKNNFPKLKVFRQDLTDYFAVKNIFENNSIDAVFNLAILPLPACLTNPEWVYNKNIQMTSTLCELARKGLFKTLIHFSSSEAYGELADEKISETHTLAPTTPYAASKAASDLNVMAYNATFGVDMAIIRPFNNYGPRQNEFSYAGIIPLTIRRVLQGKNPVIYGDGNQTRDYIYVTETAAAAIKIANNTQSRGKVINIATGREIPINYLVKLICEHMGKPHLRVEYSPARPGDIRRHFVDVSLAKTLLNFSSEMNFETGLKKTVDWFKENIITHEKKC